MASVLRFTNANIVTNEAAIVLDGAGEIRDLSNVYALGNFALNGTGGSFRITNFSFPTVPAFENQGVMIIDGIAALTVNGLYLQTGGTTTIRGGALSASGGVDIQGGILGGDGTIGTPLSNSAEPNPATAATSSIRGYRVTNVSPAYNVTVSRIPRTMSGLRPYLSLDRPNTIWPKTIANP